MGHRIRPISDYVCLDLSELSTIARYIDIGYCKSPYPVNWVLIVFLFPLKQIESRALKGPTF